MRDTFWKSFYEKHFLQIVLWERGLSFVDRYCSTLDGYCSTVQGLLDWFEVDLGFTELSFIQIDLCVLCVSVLYSRVSLSSCPFLDILHCLRRAVGVPLESALNLVSPMSPCGAHDTHIHIHTHTLPLAVLGVTITCSICCDRADDTSIHRGTYHIFEST